MQPFGRVLTAMITPFTEDGGLDYQRVWNLARYLTDHGQPWTKEAMDAALDHWIVLFERQKMGKEPQNRTKQ